MARNCLLDDICIVCVSLKMFLLARAPAISSSFRRFFLSLFSLYNVSCIPLMVVVTVLVSFVMFFHGSYGLSGLISSLSGWICVVSGRVYGKAHKVFLPIFCLCVVVGVCWVVRVCVPAGIAGWVACVGASLSAACGGSLGGYWARVVRASGR